jgi:hypothetical protein
MQPIPWSWNKDGVATALLKSGYIIIKIINQEGVGLS